MVTLEPAAFADVKSTASAELLKYGGFGLVQELCKVRTLVPSAGEALSLHVVHAVHL